jgi:hypothetical protein
VERGLAEEGRVPPIQAHGMPNPSLNDLICPKSAPGRVWLNPQGLAHPAGFDPIGRFETAGGFGLNWQVRDAGRHLRC